jgi:hypothetical protein
MIIFAPLDSFGQCDSTPLLEYGATGDEVKLLQKLLQNSGNDPGLIDGKFGRNTENAVIKFQEKNGLVIDGKVGPETWSALCGFITNTGPTTTGPTTTGPTTTGPTTTGPGTMNEIIKWKKVKGGYGGLEGSGGSKLKPELSKLRDQNKIQITNDEIDILQHVANVETNGFIQDINTWDSAVLSFGFMQWTLKYGELQDLIKRVSDGFKNFGIELEGVYLIKSKSDPASKAVRALGIKGVTDYNLLRSQEWAEKFFRAGLDEAIITEETKKALEELHAYESTNTLFGSIWNNHFKNPTAISLIFEAHNNLPVAARGALKNTFDQTRGQSITDKEFTEILATNILKAYKAYSPKESADHLVKTILGYIPNI